MFPGIFKSVYIHTRFEKLKQLNKEYLVPKFKILEQVMIIYCDNECDEIDN